MYDILQAVSSKVEIQKTSAMFGSYTSVRVFNPHVKLLTDAGMICERIERAGERYRIWLSITEKGKECIEKFDSLKAEFEEEKLQ